MARPPAHHGLVPSVLDRLIDPDSEGQGALRGYSPRQMMEAVRVDLENLFNTHQTAVGISEEYTQVLDSIVTYGLPDLPSLYRQVDQRSTEIPRIIAEIVTRHEPRLRDVRVSLAPVDGLGGHRIRFQIEAALNVDPSPEVAFETILELATGQTSIRSTGG